MKILTIGIQKGGTGKTTTAAALAQAALSIGKKVLVIDLDPQGSLSFAVGMDAGILAEQGSSYNLLHGEPAEDIIQTTKQGLDLIPAAWELQNEKTTKGSATRLKKALEPIKNNYDLIIIDTPATAGELQYNALFAATDLVIPLEADMFSLQALYQISETAKEIQRANKELIIRGFILTKLDTRSIIAKQMQEQIIIAANRDNIPYLGSIRTGVVLKEAAALQENLFDYAPKSKPAIDYMQLLNNILF